MTEKTTVVVLVDGTQIQDWVARALEVMDVEGTATVTLVISNASDPLTTKEKLSDLAAQGIWGGYKIARWGHRKLLGDVPQFRKQRSIDTINALENAQRISCTPIEDGMWNKLPGDVVRKLEQVDVALRFGFGLLKGEALQAPEYGVLSFHHGDLREYRGPPAGFWEYLDGRETAGVTLQRLNESIDKGEIAALETVDISAATTWGEVQQALFERSVTMLPKGIKQARSNSLKTIADHGVYHGYPDWIDVCKYLLKSTKSHACSRL